MKRTIQTIGMTFLAAVMAASPLQAQDKTNAAPAIMNATPAVTNAASTKADELFPDPVIAKGKGFEIKRSRFDEALSGFRVKYAQRGVELTPRDLPLLAKEAFEHLVDIAVVNPLATADDKTKAKVEADRELDVLRKQAHGDEPLASQLKAVGMTIPDLQARLLDEAVLAQVLRDRVTVTDEDVKKYYIDHPDEFDEPEKVHIHHLLLATVDTNNLAIPMDEKKARLLLAQDLVKRAHNGEDFNKLVKDYSMEPAAKDTGGELIFPRGTRRVPIEFEAASFSLTPNQVSDVVTSPVGYHIIKLDEKIAARKLEFDKVQPELRNFLEVKAVAKIMPDLTKKLRTDADLQIVDDQVKSLIARADELIKAQELKEATPLAPPPKGTNDTQK